MFVLCKRKVISFNCTTITHRDSVLPAPALGGRAGTAANNSAIIIILIIIIINK